MTRSRPAAAALLAGLLLLSGLLLTGCGRTSAAPGAPRTLTVFAAASLTDALRDLGALYEREHLGSRVTFSFAGSQSLVAQVQQGAPADVVATADTTSADALAGQLAGPARVLARNQLALVTAPGDPQRLRTLRDLARPGVRVVLAGPTVPVGRAARAALDEAGVRVRLVSEEPDVKAVVQRVRLGEADAGIAYVTDVAAARGELTGTPLPGASNPYPAGVLTSAASPREAAAFLDLALSPAGQKVFADRGFLPPP